jgi:hypothetical protein
VVLGAILKNGLIPLDALKITRGHLHMKKMSICLLVFLACSLTLTILPVGHSQVNEPQNIQVVNKSWYLDSYGSLIVVGQVQNIGQDTIDQIILTGVATTNDQLQQPSYAIVWGSNLVPQQKAPFYMEFYVPQSSYGEGNWYNNVADISLNVASANATSGYQYPDLKITSSQGSVGTTGDFSGAYVVNGNIQNTGSQATTNVTVVGTFFNSTGSVVGVGYTNYLSPRTLNPSESTSFKVAALDLNQSEVPSNLKITCYELLIQTEAPILQGTAPQSTPYTGSGGGTQNPNAPGQTSSTGGNSSIDNMVDSQTQLIVVGVVVAIVAVAAAFLFLKRRGKPYSASDSKPVNKPAYKPKPARRNRK